jgi:drug/metabolite transporter (DMT)-like permease
VNNLAGAATLGLWMTLTAGPPALPSFPQALALAAFGTVQMAIPYALFARGLREVSLAEAGLISLIEPILNPLWVVLVAHETPSRATLLGGSLLLSGVLCRYLPDAPVWTLRTRLTPPSPTPVEEQSP